MLRSSPTTRGNGIVRSRNLTPNGASRSNGNKKDGFAFVQPKTDSSKFKNNNSSPSHRQDDSKKGWTEESNDELSNIGYSAIAIHEDSRDEQEEEGFHDDSGNPYYGSSSGGGVAQHNTSSRTYPTTRPWRRRKRTSRNAIWPVTNLFQGTKSVRNQIRPRSVSSNQHLFTLVIAVALWYSLGVISISTSKLLLLKPSAPMEEMGEVAYYAHVGGVAPILLTLQQLLLGSTFLRFLLSIQCLQSSGVQPLDKLCDSSMTSSASSLSPSKSPRSSPLRSPRHEDGHQQYGSILQLYWRLLQQQHTRYLCLAGFCFSLGFYCTNLGFQAASAAFVETIKASEPITSAILAVAWGLEILNRKEVTSLGLIVCGVVLSTLGNHHAPTTDNEQDGGFGMAASLLSCTIVMTSNLCFSFRGIFQKLFQAKKSQNSIMIHMDDLNLQYRMQQMGVLVFLVPAILWEGRSVLGHIYQVSLHVGLIQSGVLFQYVGLASVNAMAFASYNLASTFLLSRISVVHHAALNCIRRIFAIVVTSILFANPISGTGMMGILISFGGFMSFTHAKAQKNRRTNANLLPLSKSQS